MNIDDLNNKKIAIAGYGVEGKAVAGFLDEYKIKYQVLDQKDGSQYLDNAKDYEIIFRSPGIKLSELRLVEAAQSGTIITSQIKYFFENCPAKIIGVTGSKGKGTTSKLIFEILQKAKINSYIAGNIGLPAIDLLKKLKADDYVILELSSFQLQDLDLSPHIAVVFMVVPSILITIPEWKNTLKLRALS
ncbi:MAG: hypothetical protein NVS3B9_5360 [Candidatus Doudnabacteria bacterium]